MSVMKVVKENMKSLIDYLSEIARNTDRSFYIYITVLLVILITGFVTWGFILVIGGGITNSSDFIPWGIFIVAFVFFVGTSAGATIIGLLIYAFGRDDYKPLAIRGIVIGLVSLLGAVLNLLADSGTPLRGMLMPFLIRNMSSMLIYTMSTYVAFGVVLITELFFAVRVVMGSKSSFDKNMAKWLAIGAVPFALVVLHAPHGALFAVVKAREYWHTPLLPPHFAVSALVSGTALMILVAILLSRLHKKDIVGLSTLSHMGALLAFFISVNIFMDAFDHLVVEYSQEPEGREVLRLLFGRFAPLFILNFFGLIAALIMLLTNWGRKTVKGLTTVSC
ncbi:MAG: NrfD/PsrC family molybdoenzyme membrane anchor subunit, partial [Planctomycetota bacterium]